MRQRFVGAACALLLAACQPSEEAAPASLAQDWRLVGFSVGPVPPRVQMDLRVAGEAAGQGPCNRWSGKVEGSWPEFHLRGVTATEMACPDLAAEQALHQALGRVAMAELVGDQLILTGPEGLRLTFAP